MHLLYSTLILLIQFLFPGYYAVKPEPVLRDYLALFRQEYKVAQSNVIVMNTWTDSTHVYYEGKVIDGYEGVPIEHQTISECKIETELYSTKGDLLSKDVGLLNEYDDQASFMICFHKDNTVCNILSYENAYMNGIPVLQQIEDMYHLQSVDNDPDIKDRYPFIVDNPAWFDGDLGAFIRDINREIERRCIYSDMQRRVTLTVLVDKHGLYKNVELRTSSGDSSVDKEILNCVEEAVKTAKFTIGTHRGIPVESYVAIPIIVQRKPQ